MLNEDMANKIMEMISESTEESINKAIALDTDGMRNDSMSTYDDTEYWLEKIRDHVYERLENLDILQYHRCQYVGGVCRICGRDDEV